MKIPQLWIRHFWSRHENNRFVVVLSEETRKHIFFHSNFSTIQKSIVKLYPSEIFTKSAWNLNSCLMNLKMWNNDIFRSLVVDNFHSSIAIDFLCIRISKRRAIHSKKTSLKNKEFTPTSALLISPTLILAKSMGYWNAPWVIEFTNWTMEKILRRILHFSK